MAPTQRRGVIVVKVREVNSLQRAANVTRPEDGGGAVVDYTA